MDKYMIMQKSKDGVFLYNDRFTSAQILSDYLYPELVIYAADNGYEYEYTHQTFLDRTLYAFENVLKNNTGIIDIAQAISLDWPDGLDKRIYVIV